MALVLDENLDPEWADILPSTEGKQEGDVLMLDSILAVDWAPPADPFPEGGTNGMVLTLSGGTPAWDYIRLI
jgi:hypothetical protein